MRDAGDTVRRVREHAAPWSPALAILAAVFLAAGCTHCPTTPLAGAPPMPRVIESEARTRCRREHPEIPDVEHLDDA